MKKIILIIITLFLTTGCFNYLSLNDIAVVSLVHIDYQDNKYILTVEIRENETVLTKISLAFDTEEYRFPGEAFDFNKEFVITALENMNRRVINNVYKR